MTTRRPTVIQRPPVDGPWSLPMTEHIVKLQLSEREKLVLTILSIERIVNTTIRGLGDGTTTDTDCAYKDWTEHDNEVKRLVVKLWEVTRVAVSEGMNEQWTGI